MFDHFVDGLREHFGRYGDIAECMVMRDPVTKRSRFVYIVIMHYIIIFINSYHYGKDNIIVLFHSMIIYVVIFIDIT